MAIFAAAVLASPVHAIPAFSPLSTAGRKIDWRQALDDWRRYSDSQGVRRIFFARDDRETPQACGRYALQLQTSAIGAFLVGECDAANGGTPVTLMDSQRSSTTSVVLECQSKRSFEPSQSIAPRARRRFTL